MIIKDYKKTKSLSVVAPAVDIFENESEIIGYADMSGVVKEDLFVNIDNGMLFFSGMKKLEAKGTATLEEFGNVKYVRSFSVPP